MNNALKALNEGRMVEVVAEYSMVCTMVVVTAYTAWVLNAGTALSSLPIA